MSDLAKLVNNGLLESQQTAQTLNADADAAITSVCTFTRNRTEVLQRFFENYARAARTCGRQIRFVLADQSDEHTTRQANLHVLQNISDEFKIPCFYAAQQEKADYCLKLSAAADVPLELVRFAISAQEYKLPAYGANRNTLLLATLGELTIQAGDDSICNLRAAPGFTPGLEFNSDINPQELYHLSPEEYESYEHQDESQNVFSIHEQLLGKQLHACVEQYTSEAQALDLKRCTPNFCSKIKPWHVAVTGTGFLGDSNTGTSYWSLFGRGKTRDSLLRSEDFYRFAMSTNLVSRSVSRLTVGDRGWKGSPCEGLDNRKALPPFMPVERGEDVIFGMLLESCRSGYFGYLPWMVRHSRTARHSFQSAELTQFVKRTCSYTLMKLLLERAQKQAGPGTADADENLKAVGKHLEAFALLPEKEFEELVWQALSTSWLKQIDQLEGALKRYDGQPQFWASDIKQCLGALQEAVSHRKLDSISLSTSQVIIKNFGALIQAWPSLRQAASELNSRGTYLARSVNLT